ncbi:MAG: phosphatidylserine decarboxylase [Deltaproteobacteria bacterium]|nr:phosphatidylserine decarboxylase [Deltaproteobacteria bacterium]
MSRSLFRRLTVPALRLLPRSALSRAAGRVAQIRLPAPLRAPACRAFGRAVGVDFSEVRDPLGSFDSLQAFFTRALREDARPIDSAADAIVAPCDGSWGESGVITQGTLLQLKGRPYSLAALLGEASDAAAFEGGCYATFYLSPRDYHRFHAPCAVRIESARSLPGTLFPVNRLGLEGVDSLFAQNERVCAFFEVGPPGSGSLCVVAVGATMVGRVRVLFDELTTNVRGAVRTDRTYGKTGARYARGEEWGRFEFGSTLVLLLPPGAGTLEVRPPGTALRLGTRIGRLAGGPPSGQPPV